MAIQTHVSIVASGQTLFCADASKIINIVWEMVPVFSAWIFQSFQTINKILLPVHHQNSSLQRKKVKRAIPSFQGFWFLFSYNFWKKHSFLTILSFVNLSKLLSQSDATFGFVSEGPFWQRFKLIGFVLKLHVASVAVRSTCLSDTILHLDLV